MKSLVTLFIILNIALRPLMPLVDYAINYDFINKNLCENIAKPQVLCNGKCYLKKELAKASGNQTKNDSRISISTFCDHFIINEKYAFINLIANDLLRSAVNYELDFSYQFNLFSTIFHPPLV